MAEAKKKRGFGAWILVALLFVGLIGFGSTNLGGSVQTVARVGSQEITAQAYANAVRRQMDAFSRQLGVPVTLAQAQAIGLDRSVLGQLIAQAALDEEMARLGLAAGDLRVRDTILSIPEFQALDGSFDRERYRLILSGQGLTETEFEESIRAEMARTLIARAAIAGSAAPEAFARAIVLWSEETRDITWAALGQEALADPVPAPTDAEVQAQYDANPALYTRPEVRNITYAWLSPDMIMDSVPVDEADVQALYDSRIAEFVIPERRLVERLVYPDAAAAAAAHARLTAGEVDFDTLVTERGLILSDVDLGDVGVEDLGGAGDAVFALAAGEVTAPVETELGPALFRVNAVLAAQETDFATAAPELRAELASQRARRTIQDRAEDFMNLLAGGATLEDLAAAEGMELGTIAWSEGMTEGIAAYDAFRAAAAAAQPDDFPELREFDDGGVFAIRLDSVEAPVLEPLEAVRDRVAADATAVATAAAVLARAEALGETVRAGGFDQPDLPLVPVVMPRITREEAVPGTPADFAERAFAMAPGEVAVIAHEGNAIILRLDAVNAADAAAEETAAMIAGLGAELAAGIDRDILDAMTLAAQLGVEVTVDEAVIAAANAQMQ